MKKFVVAVVIMLVCGLLFSGCMVNSGEVVVNENGSGTCTLYTGYTEEAYNNIVEAFSDEAESGNELVPFTYNGKQYIGQVVTFSFDTIEELNDTMLLHSQSVDTGVLEFTVSDDSKLVFTLTTNENTGNTDELEQQADAFEIDEGTAKMLEEMVAVYKIAFPGEVKQTLGPQAEGISVVNNEVTIDYIKLANSLAGEKTSFVFESSIALPDSNSLISFDDVTESDWYYEQVMKMTEAGLFKGKGNNLFCPSDTMNKAEFVTVIARLMYDKPSLNLYPGNINIWWDKYYQICSEDGIFTPDKISYDSMEQGIERQEMAEIAFGFIEKYESFDEIDVEKFAEKIPDYDKVDEKFKNSVAYCYYLGIICGTDDKGSFNPEGTLTRAEASTVIYRLTEHK